MTNSNKSNYKLNDCVSSKETIARNITCSDRFCLQNRIISKDLFPENRSSPIRRRTESRKKLIMRLAIGNRTYFPNSQSNMFDSFAATRASSRHTIGPHVSFVVHAIHLCVRALTIETRVLESDANPTLPVCNHLGRDIS